MTHEAIQPIDLPAWEVLYEPGNVSDYLIGYCNDEAPAKAAGEAWLRSQKDEVGRLEWDEFSTTTGRWDAWWQLTEIGELGETDPGILVRRRAPVPSAEQGSEHTGGSRG